MLGKGFVMSLGDFELNHQNQEDKPTDRNQRKKHGRRATQKEKIENQT